MNSITMNGMAKHNGQWFPSMQDTPLRTAPVSSKRRRRQIILKL